MKRINRLLRAILPEKYYVAIKSIKTSISCLLNSLWNYGFSYYCPCCNWHFRSFMSYGTKLRSNVLCHRCLSLERHRLLWLYLKNKTNFFKDSLKVLDIAPMPFLNKQFKKTANIDYFSADLSSPLAMLKMDIQNIPFYDGQFDCILCYHVLEHIPDDRKAMKELFRILKPGGWAIIQSAISNELEHTFEDARIVSPNQREKAFGEKNHLRICGRNYKSRLEEAGFLVKVDDFVKQIDTFFVKSYALDKEEEIYFCVKPD